MNKIAKLILLVFALSTMAYAQGVCSVVAVANPTSGTTVVLTGRSPTFYLCQIQIQIVQGASPANYSVVYGPGASCSPRAGSITPVWAGTASATDYYWFKPDAPVAIPDGNNICLVLSATPTSAGISLNYRN